MILPDISYNTKSSRTTTLGFAKKNHPKNRGFFAWQSSAEGCLVAYSKLNNPSMALDARGCHTTLALQWTPVDTKLLAGSGKVVRSLQHCLPLQQKLSDHSPSMRLILILLLMWLSQVHLSHLIFCYR